MPNKSVFSSPELLHRIEIFGLRINKELMQARGERYMALLQLYLHFSENRWKERIDKMMFYYEREFLRIQQRLDDFSMLQLQSDY